MQALPGLALQTPLALWLLLLVPLVWLVARAVPPAPQRQLFPPAVLMERLAPTEETPRSAPPWLTLLRMLALAILICGLAGPSLVPREGRDSRPLVIVIDNGWTLAGNWAAVREEAAALARSAEGPVRLILTAPDDEAARAGLPEELPPQRAAAAILALTPRPWLPDAAAALPRLSAVPQGVRTVWWSDGVGHAGLAEAARVLAARGPVTVRLPEAGPIAITNATPTSQGFQLALTRGPGAAGTVTVEAVDSDGRVLASGPASSPSGAAALAVPDTEAGRVAMIRVRGQASAGSTWLQDSFGRRPRVGIVAERRELQPLLADAHYLEAALSPHGSMVRGPAQELAQAGLDAILLPDTGQLDEADAAALERFVNRGGLLVRFAGPRLAAAAGEAQLLPLAVSPTPRRLDGALTWSAADAMAPFARTSPFAGLTAPADARIRQIVAAADPAAPAPETWARLSDGSPLVSAGGMGRGTLVLFHTTAGPAWSDVAFSGLQVAMLRRVLARAGSRALPTSVLAPVLPLKAVLVLDGNGRTAAPDGRERSIAPAEVSTAVPGPGRPPGIYEAGGSRLVLQTARPGLRLPPLPPLPAGVTTVSAAPDAPRPLGGWLVAAAAGLLLLEMILALALAGHLRGVAGRLPGLRRAAPGTAAVVAGLALWLAASLLPQAGGAQPFQDPFGPPPSTAQSREPDDLQLAYIRTGDSAMDARARAGLEGLGRVLTERTTVEPGAVAELDPATAPLALYPVIYWLLPDNPQPLGPDAARALNRYMRSGGLLFVDSRGAGGTAATAQARVRTALRGLEIPPLEQVPANHVLTRTFYLLRGFPGRYGSTRLFTESAASAQASANDGVSPILIGDGDWAAAWASRPDGRAVAAVEGGEPGREGALRAGVNIVMYALTGNYKADQVHMPALIERLGRPSVAPE